jgi:hypothetical protein
LSQDYLSEEYLLGGVLRRDCGYITKLLPAAVRSEEAEENLWRINLQTKALPLPYELFMNVLFDIYAPSNPID